MKRGESTSAVPGGWTMMAQRMGQRRWLWLTPLCVALVTALIVAGWGLHLPAAQAQDAPQTDSTQADSTQADTAQEQDAAQADTVQEQDAAQAGASQAQFVPSPNTTCLLCHLDATETYTLPSGESFGVDVDPTVLDASVHGDHAEVDILCTDCHVNGDRYRYPHVPNPADTVAEFEAAIGQNCEQCHVPLTQHNPGHLLAEEQAGLPNCIDCHGGHAVTETDAMAADPIGTCQTCHTDFAELGEVEAVQEMHERVVGKLSNDGPTCQTCHADTPPATADAECKTCHTLLDGTLTLESGEEIPLEVHPEVLMDSVHGERSVQGVDYPALQCVDCHTVDTYTFPHEPVEAETAREYTLAREAICADCHTEIVELNETSVHALALEAGNEDAASCVDCHGAHDTQPPDEPRSQVSQTCATCHSTIYEQYATSVHGAALLDESNPDVPVCTDCHGAHDIVDPTTAEFRLRSPELCAECHADEELMHQYDISTEVFDTYVADFHGTTVTLFEQTAPDQETNKAVCYDCHGVHNILPANDENSQVIKENLLATCRQCHPDANANFPDSWMSHFKPSWERNRLVYVINLFYQILIPSLVGGFALFIGSDVVRRWWDRRRSRRPAGDKPDTRNQEGGDA